MVHLGQAGMVGSWRGLVVGVTGNVYVAKKVNLMEFVAT